MAVAIRQWRGAGRGGRERQRNRRCGSAGARSGGSDHWPGRCPGPWQRPWQRPRQGQTKQVSVVCLLAIWQFHSVRRVRCGQRSQSAVSAVMAWQPLSSVVLLSPPQLLGTLFVTDYTLLWCDLQKHCLMIVREIHRYVKRESARDGY